MELMGVCSCYGCDSTMRIGDFPWIAVQFMEKHDPQVLCKHPRLLVWRTSLRRLI